MAGTGDHRSDPVRRIMAVDLHEGRQNPSIYEGALDHNADDRHGLVGEVERRVVDPEEPGFRLHHISFRPPVTWSTIAFGQADPEAR